MLQLEGAKRDVLQYLRSHPRIRPEGATPENLRYHFCLDEHRQVYGSDVVFAALDALVHDGWVHAHGSQDQPRYYALTVVTAPATADATPEGLDAVYGSDWDVPELPAVQQDQEPAPQEPSGPVREPI